MSRYFAERNIYMTDVQGSIGSYGDEVNSGHTTPPSHAEFILDNAVVDEDSTVVAPIPDDLHGDKMLLPAWRRHIARFVGFSALLPQILLVWASAIQYRTLIQLGRDGTLSSGSFILACGTILMDLLWTFDSLLHVCIKLGALTGRWQPRLCLLGENVPPVDVIVTVCNERFDIVRDTVCAALSIDYPRRRFRVIVADDGRSEKLRSWVAQSSLEHPNLYYTAREILGGWKAGNLNSAVKFVERLPGGAAEFVAGLDADMIPEPRWLRTVTAHMMRDRRLGVVCPAQNFYNIPSDDPLYQANTFSWSARDLICDLAGAGFNLGSGWIMRREAIDDIGGFPTDVLTEDITSSMMTMAEGWKTAYIPESLQWGLVPETYAAHVKQLTRWYIGGCQMAIKFGFFLLPSRTKRLTPSQVAIGLAQGISVHIRTQMITCSLLITGLVFITDTNLAYWRDNGEMRLLLKIHCAVILLRWIHDCHLSILSGYSSAVWELSHAIYLAPYATVAWFKTFILPHSIGGKMAVFTSTGSLGNMTHERDPHRRAPIFKRLRHVIFDCGAWIHTLVLVVFGLGAWLRLSRILTSYSVGNHNEDELANLWIQLLQKVAWPSHPWFITTMACFTPLKYAIFPPQTPDRDRLLGKKGRNAQRYPIPEAMGNIKRTVKGFGFVELYTLFVACVAVVFVAIW